MRKQTSDQIAAILDPKKLRKLRKKGLEEALKDAHQSALYDRERVAVVLFDLLRDHLPFGKLESVVRELEKSSGPFEYAGETAKSQGDLARHLATRILSA